MTLITSNGGYRVVEIFQYIHEYTELNKGLKDLNKYNIFKKKKIVNEMNDLEDKLRNTDIYDLLNAIYNYVYMHKYVETYVLDDNLSRIDFRDNGFIYISNPDKYYVEYSLNGKGFHISYRSKSFYVSYKQEIKNSNLKSIWETVNSNVHELIISLIKLL